MNCDNFLDNWHGFFKKSHKKYKNVNNNELSLIEIKNFERKSLCNLLQDFIVKEKGKLINDSLTKCKKKKNYINCILMKYTVSWQITKYPYIFFTNHLLTVLCLNIIVYLFYWFFLSINQCIRVMAITTENNSYKIFKSNGWTHCNNTNL